MNNLYEIGKNIDVRIATREELSVIMFFQKEIIDNMTNKEWFVPLTREEFLTSIDGIDNTYFLLYKNQIIGLFVLTGNISNILIDYQLPSNNYLLIDSIMIKEDYRGYNLQRQILQYAYQRAIDLKMDGLVASIHPDNKYSLDNFVAEDYKLLHVLNIHGGIRNIMVKEVNNERSV